MAESKSALEEVFSEPETGIAEEELEELDGECGKERLTLWN